MTDFLTSVSPFLVFYIKACAVLTAVGIIMFVALWAYVLALYIAERMKKHGKR